jgi:rare lipoprotein A
MLRHVASLFVSLVMGSSFLATAPVVHGKTNSHADVQRGTQVGIASVYSKTLNGKKTASGKPFKPGALTAASRNLPLNSKAKVTNLKTGESANVTINDRGPYKKDRVIDLSPAAADHIGLDKKEGLTPVEVKPITPAEPQAGQAVAETPAP